MNEVKKELEILFNGKEKNLSNIVMDYLVKECLVCKDVEICNSIVSLNCSTPYDCSYNHHENDLIGICEDCSNNICSECFILQCPNNKQVCNLNECSNCETKICDDCMFEEMFTCEICDTNYCFSCEDIVIKTDGERNCGPCYRNL